MSTPSTQLSTSFGLVAIISVNSCSVRMRSTEVLSRESAFNVPIIVELLGLSTPSTATSFSSSCLPSLSLIVALSFTSVMPNVELLPIMKMKFVTFLFPFSGTRLHELFTTVTNWSG